MVRYYCHRIPLPSACAQSDTSTIVLLLSLDQNTEETAVAAYWVTDGIDRCRVGFLPRYCVRQATTFDGHLVQVVASWQTLIALLNDVFHDTTVGPAMQQLKTQK